MEAFKCDRCGNFFEGTGCDEKNIDFDMDGLEIKVCLEMKWRGHSHDESIDLCDDCIAKIAQELTDELTTKC